MDNTVATTFYTDDDSPLIQYEIVFQKRPKLLMAGTGAFGGSSGASEVYAGVTESLEDDIRWEPHIDEADKLDYIVAVSSGVLSGLIDVFYVGEFSLDRASKWGKDKIEEVIMKVARMEGYTGDDLNDAIKVLEKNHPLAADGNTNDFGGGLQHHLRDFSHHFSIGGLFFSIFTQFTGLVVGTDKAGMLHVAPIPESHRVCIGRNFQEKIAFGTIGWFFHMVSDMAGSSCSIMGGTGVRAYGPGRAAAGGGGAGWAASSPREGCERLRARVGVAGAHVALRGPEALTGARREGRERMPRPTTARGRAWKRSSPYAVAECAPQRGADPPSATYDSHQAPPRAEAVYARGARGRRRSRSVRPPRRADGAAGWPEPGATRRRSRLTRAAAQYTAGAAGGAVRIAPCARGGAGPSRARNGAEAGGLRTALDDERAVVGRGISS